MKVVYFFRSSLLQNSGVDKKITSQINSLRTNNVDCIAYPVFWEDIPAIHNKYVQIIRRSFFYFPLRVINIVKRELLIIKKMRDALSSLTENDILYMRIQYPSFLLSRLLSRVRTCKIVIEYQTIEPVEYRLKRKYLYLIIDLFHGDAIRKYADAIVGVTDEITRYQLNRSGITNKPHITLGNGFDVASVHVRDPRQYDNTELHLLCVANVSKWHGLDRLLKGMAEYPGNTRIIFHIAGDGDEIMSLRQLVEKFNLWNQVIFHGFKTGEELDTLFNTCHIAVGSLGIHRKGLTQTSELKAREYCARGIPYIIACADPDFPDDFPYIHRVSPNDSQIDIEKIIEFAQMVCADPDHPRKMRAYALEYLDWDVKMKTLKAFLETLVGEPESII